MKNIIYALTVVLVLLCGYFERLPHSSGDIRSLFPISSKLLENYRETNRLFGNFVTDIVVVNVGKEPSLEQSELIHDLEFDLMQQDGVIEVISPLLAFSKLAKPPLPLVNEEKGVSRFLIRIDGRLNDKTRSKLNHSIDSILDEYQELNPSRTGAFYISESVTNVIERETQRRVPFTLLTLLSVTVILLRSIRISLAVLLAPALTVVWTVLLASLYGLALGPISQLVPPFLLAISASYSIHVAARARRCATNDLPATRKEMRSAVSIAALTTAVGLTSLIFMNIRAIEEFAILAAIGSTLAAFFSLTITFPLMANAARKEEPRETAFKAPLEKKYWVLTILVFTACAGMGVPKISVHTDPMMFLPKTTPERMQIDRSLVAFPGNRIVSAVFTKNGKTLGDDDFQSIGIVANDLKKLPSVFSVVWDGDFAEINTQKESAISIASPRLVNGPDSISREDSQATRVLIETNLEGAELLAFANLIEKQTTSSLQRSKNPNDLSFHVSSLELLIASQTALIVNGIILSLLFTLVIVAILLFILFKDIWLVAIGLIPNVIPIVVVLGSIGWLYGDINLGASLVGAAALSIAVDNTFHFIISWREELRCSKTNSTSATVRTMNKCFPSFITTSIVLTTGFAMMAISAVLPVQQFGLLLAITLLVGLQADTLVLPYFLQLYENRARGNLLTSELSISTSAKE